MEIIDIKTLEPGDGLNRDNFFNQLEAEMPQVHLLFTRWLDSYKLRINWKGKFGWLLLFHDLPFEMQLGILFSFFGEVVEMNEGNFVECDNTEPEDIAWYIHHCFEMLEAQLKESDYLLRTCKKCGCHHFDACVHTEHGNCSWVGVDICSHCQNWPGEAKRYSELNKEPLLSIMIPSGGLKDQHGNAVPDIVPVTSSWEVKEVDHTPAKDGEFEIWSEGYRATGEHGTATKYGNFPGATFDEAVEAMLKADPDRAKLYRHRPEYKGREHAIWGCALFDNEADARKSFG